MKIKRFSILLFFTVFFMGCADVLDKRDLNAVNDIVWDNAEQAMLYVNNLYVDNMPDMSLGENSAFSDEIYSPAQDYVDILYGLKSSNDIDAVKEFFHREKYQLIRGINFCVKGLKESSLEDSIKGTALGQALFFRAWRYWEIVRLHGGVPMILEPQDPYSDEMDVPRSSTAESVAQIVKDLDDAIDMLPVEWPLAEDYGRITSGAAAAFKGRILLAWASPLFNRNNDADRWQQAYDANKQANELLQQMSTPRALHPDFSAIFTSNVLTNTEAIIFRRYDLGAGSTYTNEWESNVRPRSMGGSFGFNPTWELVKAFPMSNGKLINESGSGYDSTYFWQNRDPRFYATIAYNGCEWEMVGRTNTTQWSYNRNRFEANTRSSTSFYNRKATNPSVTVENISQVNTTWHELRYAEVLLNLAECANEIGNTQEALTNVRAVRERAGIEANGGIFGIENGVSKDKLRQIIMIERQVEFAFENKRYWDLRRRLVFRNDLGDFVKKLNGRKRHGFELSPKSPWSGRITDRNSEYYGYNRIDTAAYFGYIDVNDAENYNSYFDIEYVEKETTLNGEVQSFNYLELYDFFAVPSNVINKSPAVEQTIGWGTDGTFDPLEE
ncbi:MAG: RagB/SusD family nutrient uptake outer membrane protein [Prolixibacteraceae bacterium]|jgi:hypothetical protein|nr:RagB/SusD family nutrient uptake outer membrane protein [Prolixibacteraceae bacterium]